MPTTLTNSEGNMEHGGNRKSCSDPARSKTLRMSGSNLHRSWEISAVSGKLPDGVEKASGRNVAIDAAEKPGWPVTAMR
ncbi:hypothetical protein [Massilia genomosp. 1]|uniref:Uncharacterized protein n=1 Tax=Massilia genomosp. 1 TaxID=2609280 RepID=A0ABX0MZZ1_9BURK|nr:hypothetical protein [Massilia genomosp. 1]NHZ65811.1 hypothetical protein [Massilia genomosp. 1]